MSALVAHVGAAVVGAELNGAEKQTPERTMCVLANGADAAAEFKWYTTKYAEVDDGDEDDGGTMAEFYGEREFQKARDDEQID